MGFFDQAKMMNEARKLQKELRAIKIEVEKMDGKIKVVMNGEGQVEDIHIDEGVSNVDIVTYLKQAINEGMGKVQREAAAKMQEITGGLNFPGM